MLCRHSESLKAWWLSHVDVEFWTWWWSQLDVDVDLIMGWLMLNIHFVLNVNDRWWIKPSVIFNVHGCSDWVSVECWIWVNVVFRYELDWCNFIFLDSLYSDMYWIKGIWFASSHSNWIVYFSIKRLKYFLMETWPNGWCIFKWSLNGN